MFIRYFVFFSLSSLNHYFCSLYEWRIQCLTKELWNYNTEKKGKPVEIFECWFCWIWGNFFFFFELSLCLPLCTHMYIHTHSLSLFVYIWNERLLWDSFLCFIKTIFSFFCCCCSTIFFFSRFECEADFFFCLYWIRLRSFLSSFEFFAISRIIKPHVRSMHSIPFGGCSNHFLFWKSISPFYYAQAHTRHQKRIHMWMALLFSFSFTNIRICHHFLVHIHNFRFFLYCASAFGDYSVM